MTKDTANEVLGAWETSSKFWNKHQALIEKMYATLSLALIEDARIGPGQAVLDVGGGSGEPSLTIAPIVARRDLWPIPILQPEWSTPHAAQLKSVN